MIALITTWVLSTWPALERWHWWILGALLPELGRREAARRPSVEPSEEEQKEAALWPFVRAAQIGRTLPGLRVIAFDRLGPGIPGSDHGCFVVGVAVVERGKPGSRHLTRAEWDRARAAGVPLLGYDAAQQLRALRGLAGGAS